MRIAFIDKVHPLLAERLERAGHECVSLHDHGDAELVRELPAVQGIVVRSRVLGAGLLGHAKELRFIGRVGSGTENIDRAHCDAHGVELFNSPEGNRDGVGETTLLLILMLLKNAAKANEQVHKGLWLREENRGHDLEGRTVGIIGFGHMGSAFAQRLQGFGVRVLAYDKYLRQYAPPHVTETDLDTVQDHSDVISVHLPLTAGTHHFIDASFIERMRRPFHLINTARGAVVHTKALLDGLDTGKVLGAGLDVLEFERPDLDGLDPGSDPHTLKRLFAHSRVVLTPHIAGVTHEGKRKMAEVLAGKILNAFPDVHA